MPDDRSRVDIDAYRHQLEDHEGWLISGRALLRSAELLWPVVRDGFDQLEAAAAARRTFADAALARGVKPGSREFAALMQSAPPVVMPMDALLTLTGHGHTYLLLTGYAVENFLKAIRVKRLLRDGLPIAFGGGADKLPTKHKYEEIARLELGSLAEHEIELLRRLSLFVRWGGRYPLANAPPVVAEANGRVVADKDHREVTAFCDRLITKYESLT